MSTSTTVTSINVNGIRAAVKQRSEKNLGMLPWLEQTGADVVALQETRAELEQIVKALAPALERGWYLTAAPSEVKGRNGVAILSRLEPDAVRVGFGSSEFDAAGRYLEADFGRLTVASLYLPSGDVGTERQDEKDRFRKEFGGYLAKLGRKRRDVVVCGDWNIGHTELDIKNWKGNVKNSGFLPEERAWMSEHIGAGRAFKDVVRELHPETAGPYSWWSWRGKAFDNDAGWRIDLQIANNALAGHARAARVERAAEYALRWSDHAPVTVEYSAASPR
ncbi:exodeoxyribonuclease III [Tsukamurella sp. 8F]|uniref:exodeoxyribonuclease III n=1 Tax=unclassified Tsukamurella TaxID=2633480 RepID=UPI0023BA1045|nr:MULTISPECIES: exodeoxyribonuclease III [unclassified Tsukamurella]MDF0531833.1 exodeoxyribonuclease III [Tsukamurella sp. 8J]MDF0589089.1 exodeoxyribonuclease III [Tsukamurella sp. 8F]